MGGQSNSFLHLTLATLIFSIKRYLFKSDSLENVLNEQCDALQNIRIKKLASSYPTQTSTST